MEYLHTYLFFTNDYQKTIITNISRSCANIYISKNNIFYKRIIFRLLNSKKRIINYLKKEKFAFVFFDRLLKRASRSNKKIIFYFIGFDLKIYYEYQLGNYIRTHYKNAKIVFTFSDMVEKYYKWFNNFSISNIKKEFDIITTYNVNDSIKNGLLLELPKLYFCDNVKSDKKTDNFDIFFVGIDKGRLNKILQFASKCIELGFSIKFLIIGVSDEKKIKIDGVYYLEKYVPYEKILSIEKKAKAILNIVQDGVNGITLRDCEAISMNKILITSNDWIANTHFYDKNKVIFINSFEQDNYKINSNSCASWKLTQNYSKLSFYNHIEKNIKKIK